MKLSIKAILDYKNLHPIKESLDKIVRDCSENPVFFSSYTKEFIEVNRLRGWTPLILVIYDGLSPVGFAPLQIKCKFGVPIVSFMHRPILPDFVIYDKYREKSIEKIIDFVFGNLNCQLADLTLRAESPNIKPLQKICKKKSINFRKNLEVGDEKGRLVVSIHGTWEEYIKKRGRIFRKRIRQTTKKLNNAGFWKITRIDNEKIDENTIKKVYDIDENSWKKEWRTRKAEEKDPYLLLLLKGSMNTPFTASFSANVYFLELNKNPIAFVIIIQYKKVAYLIKTSFKQKYKRFSPGKFVINCAICEIFNTKEAKQVDFITALHFLKTWASIYKPRIKIVAAKKNLIPITMSLFLSSPHIRKIYKTIQTKIPAIDIW